MSGAQEGCFMAFHFFVFSLGSTEDIRKLGYLLTDVLSLNYLLKRFPHIIDNGREKELSSYSTCPLAQGKLNITAQIK